MRLIEKYNEIFLNNNIEKVHEFLKIMEGIVAKAYFPLFQISSQTQMLI
jgi:hypothetical protein